MRSVLLLLHLQRTDGLTVYNVLNGFGRRKWSWKKTLSNLPLCTRTVAANLARLCLSSLYPVPVQHDLGWFHTWALGGRGGRGQRLLAKGGATFDPAGGQKISSGGQRGEQQKNSSNLKKAKNMSFTGKYWFFWPPSTAREGTVLHKEVHQGGEWFLDIQKGSFPPPPVPPLRPRMVDPLATLIWYTLYTLYYWTIPTPCAIVSYKNTSLQFDSALSRVACGTTTART